MNKLLSKATVSKRVTEEDIPEENLGRPPGETGVCKRSYPPHSIRLGNVTTHSSPRISRDKSRMKDKMDSS